MTEEEKLRILEKLATNANIGQVIIDNHGTMNINNHMGTGSSEKKEKNEMPDWDVVAQALRQVQDLFWGNSSYAVIYCSLRDFFSYKGNRSQFEREMALLELRIKSKYSCTPGVVSSTFNDNKYMELPIDKWGISKAPDRVMKLAKDFETTIKKLTSAEIVP